MKKQTLICLAYVNIYQLGAVLISLTVWFVGENTQNKHHTGGTRIQLFWIIYDIGTDTLHFGTDTSPKVVQIINLATETPSFSV